ncbi:MAG: hypothetical protein ACI8YP_000790 [Algoriphagus sp.]|jgi:hypothetical protein
MYYFPNDNLQSLNLTGLYGQYITFNTVKFWHNYFLCLPQAQFSNLNKNEFIWL